MLQIARNSILALLLVITSSLVLYWVFNQKAEPIEAAANSTINFQGKIVNKTSGTNLVTGTPSCVASGAGNDTCDFRVNIYTESSGGTLLFREPHANIEVGEYNGVFNFQINSVCNNWTTPGGSCSGTGITWGSDPTIYIEVEFDPDGDGDFAEGETFTRKLLTSVPYAYYADSAGSIAGFTSTDFVQFRPGSAQTSGNTSNALIWLNENGSGTPNLLDLEVGGSDVFVVDNGGNVISDGGFAFGDTALGVYDFALIQNLVGGSLGGDPTNRGLHVVVDNNSANASTDFFGIESNTTISASALSAIGIQSRMTLDNNTFIDILAGFKTDISVGPGVSDSAYATAVVGVYVTDPSVGALATLEENYGVYVENLNSGTSDYGVYIGGADTYALWVDNDIARFDDGIQLDADPNDLISQSSSGTGPSANLYYGNLLLCDATQTNCGWATAATSLFTDGGTTTYLTSTTDDFAIGGSGLASPFSVDVSANTVRIGEGANSNGVLAMYSLNGDTGTISYLTTDLWQFNGGNVATDGRMAVGGGILTNAQLNVSTDITAANGLTYSGYFTATQTSVANTGEISGLYTRGRSDSASSVATVLGIDAVATLNNSGAVTNAIAGRFQVAENGTNTIASGYGIRVLASAGTITNNYGVYVDSQTAGTTDYGVYVAGSGNWSYYANAADAYFADDVLIGATAETIANAGFALSDADLFVSDQLGVEGTIYTDGDIMLQSDVTTTGTGDITISFGGTNSETLIWEDGTDLFQFSDDVAPNANDTLDLGSDNLRWNNIFGGTGGLRLGASGNQGIFLYDTTNNRFVLDPDGDATAEGLFTDNGDLSFQGALTIESDINTTGAGDVVLNFGGTNSETLTWEDTSDTFQLSDDFLPTTDDAFDLGSDTLRWRELFLGPSSLKVGVSGNQAIIGYDTTGNALGLNPSGDGTAEVTIADSGLITTSNGIVVGNNSGTTSGTIRWDGTNFQGYNGSTWVNLDVTSTSANGYLYDKHVQDSSGTNSTAVDQVVRKGWGWGNTSVTYGITYESIPIVVVSLAGASASSPANLGACGTLNATSSQYSTNATGISTTGFSITTTRDYDYQYGSPLPGTTLYNIACVTWIAIGEYTTGYGADLAENYLTHDTSLKSGEVVAIDQSNDISAKRSSGAYDDKAFGIVTTAPGQVLGNKDGTSEDRATVASVKAIEKNKKLIDEGKAKVVAIALEGRVPVKVTLENGPIKKGDYLTSASKPGYAMRATKPGNIIGRALEDFNESTPGLLQYDDPEYKVIMDAVKAGETKSLNDLIKFDGNNGEGKIMVLVERGQQLGQAEESLVTRMESLQSRVLFLQGVSATMLAGLVTIASLILYKKSKTFVKPAVNLLNNKSLRPNMYRYDI